MTVTTGCPLLDRRNVGQTALGIIHKRGEIIITNEEVIEYCLNCSLRECILDYSLERKSPESEETLAEPVSFVYQCSVCKVIETLTFRDGVMDVTQNFIQRGDKVYHKINCGECKRIGQEYE